MIYTLRLTNWKYNDYPMQVKKGDRVVIVSLTGDDVMLAPYYFDSDVDNDRWGSDFEGYVSFIATEKNIIEWETKRYDANFSEGEE